MEMSEVFWGMFLTTTIGFILGLSRVCYKSKCSTIDICCIKITRNIDAEVREDLELGNTEESKK
jgi:ABC-type amino acid transport system permease subunit